MSMKEDRVWISRSVGDQSVTISKDRPCLHSGARMLGCAYPLAILDEEMLYSLTGLRVREGERVEAAFNFVAFSRVMGGSEGQP